MSKVYVVMETVQEYPNRPYGYFSTEEKAEAYRQKLIKSWTELYMRPPMPNWFYIEEHTLDVEWGYVCV